MIKRPLQLFGELWIERYQLTCQNRNFCIHFPFIQMRCYSLHWSICTYSGRMSVFQISKYRYIADGLHISSRIIHLRQCSSSQISPCRQAVFICIVYTVIPPNWHLYNWINGELTQCGLNEMADIYKYNLLNWYCNSLIHIPLVLVHKDPMSMLAYI